MSTKTILGFWFSLRNIKDGLDNGSVGMLSDFSSNLRFFQTLLHQQKQYLHSLII